MSIESLVLLPTIETTLEPHQIISAEACPQQSLAYVTKKSFSEQSYTKAKLDTSELDPVPSSCNKLVYYLGSMLELITCSESIIVGRAFCNLALDLTNCSAELK